MHPLLPLLLSLPFTTAQKVGTQVPETHPRLQWHQCAVSGNCTAVDGEITLDANWRWLHEVDSSKNCYSNGEFDRVICRTAANCTERCALSGVGTSYTSVYGVTTNTGNVSLRLKTSFDFDHNIGSRVYLMASRTRYQTFVLLNNEVSFDVDVSTVGCGINAALTFLAMDADGGMARFPTNEAGAEYGTGYCDAQCPLDQRFVAGMANSEMWRVHADEAARAGFGGLGACCSEFALWKANSHSYTMGSQTCKSDVYFGCEGDQCDSGNRRYERERHWRDCDLWGCSYNPYRMGVPEFFGKNKTVDTTKKFTVVTRFEETQVTQFFIQGGKTIQAPAPSWPGLPKHAGLSPEMCDKLPGVFSQSDGFGGSRTWDTHKRMLSQPMVLAMSIDTDYDNYNIWLDSAYPIEEPYDQPGQIRGDCYWEDSAPASVHSQNGNAAVKWSNFKFGPIGSTTV